MTIPTADTAEHLAPDMKGSGEQLLLVGAGGELFGIPLTRCREILEARSYTAIPGAGAAVCGLINLRGRLVTVFDLGVRLERPAAAVNPEHSILVIDYEGKRLGLAVDRVVRIAEHRSEGVAPGETYSAPHRLDEIDLAASGWSGAPVYRVLEPTVVFDRAIG